MEGKREIWKVRAVKLYPEAHTHLLVGRVVARDDASIKLMCRSFHYGRVVGGVRDISVGELAMRIIPWSRVEIINELPASFDFQKAKLEADGRGSVVYSDGQSAQLIASVRKNAY
jgi:hypothetical protein